MDTGLIQAAVYDCLDAAVAPEAIRDAATFRAALVVAGFSVTEIEMVREDYVRCVIEIESGVFDLGQQLKESGFMVRTLNPWGNPGLSVSCVIGGHYSVYQSDLSTAHAMLSELLESLNALGKWEISQISQK